MNTQVATAIVERVEWSEIRADVLFFVVGELTPAGFVFQERSTWDITWLQVPAHQRARCLATALDITRARVAASGQVMRSTSLITR